jgi:hypothetical protein
MGFPLVSMDTGGRMNWIGDAEKNQKMPLRQCGWTALTAALPGLNVGAS